MTRTTWIGLVAALLFGALLAAQKQDAAETLLQTAIKKEVVDGDLKAAIEQYKRVAQSGNRVLAAQALIHMADCYRKLGDGESRKIYERIVREYADQKDAVATARARLGPGPDTLSKRITCAECGDEEASISSDGRWIAYTDWQETGDLVIRDLSTGRTKHLAAKSGTFKDSVAHVHLPLFSADSQQVAYNWETDDKENGQLRVIATAAGSQARIVLDTTPEHMFCEPVGWSADGKSILTVVTQNGGMAQLAWASASDGSLKTIKSLELRLVQFDSDRSDVRLSPDGQHIAYAALAANPSKYPAGPGAVEERHIYVLSADGSSETEVVKTAGLNRAAVWTPDGKHLLFISDRSGSAGLWSVAIENGKAAGVPSLLSSTLGTGRIWPLGITHSGSYEYVVGQDGLEQVFIDEIDSTGRKIQGRPRTESLVGMRPAWSPDGKFIAFKRHHPGSSNAYDLVVHSLATGDERTFPTTLGDHDDVTPEWFHDGKGILIKLFRSGSYAGSYRVDVESREFKQVLSTDVLHNRIAPMWLSPDDKMVYLFRGGPLAHDLATGAEKQILTVPQGGLMMHRLSPDGLTWVVWRNDRRAKKAAFAIADADGSNFREIYTPEYGASFGSFTGGRFSNLAWTRDNRTILFVQPNGDKRRILRIPAEGGSPEFTGIEVIGDILNMDISPDASRIAYSVTKPVEELWSLDNLLSALK
jgi:Tol biopolymer transport system component